MELIQCDHRTAMMQSHHAELLAAASQQCLLNHLTIPEPSVWIGGLYMRWQSIFGHDRATLQAKWQVETTPNL